MIRIIALFMLILFAGCSSRYSNMDPATAELKKMEKQAKKEAEAAYDNALYERSVEAIKNHDFVLEADRIDFKNGRFVYVTPNVNFVYLKGNKASIQLSFNSVYAGPNGIGGITVDGTASSIKIEEDKDGIFFSMFVQGAAVSASVSIRMIKGSGRCTAVVNPTFRNNRITFTGMLYPVDESNIFKGRSL